MRRIESFGAALALAICGDRAFADTPPNPQPDDRYELTADSMPKAGVAACEIRQLDLRDSKVFPGYTHQAWLYIPARYDGKSPLALMVFQDGGGFLNPDGYWRATIVLDNLISERALPMMAALFIDPGISVHDDGLASEQRSYEYDSLSDRYTNFLVDEAIPAVRKIVAITDNPEGRGLAGASSGGICAFTVAWRRPDAFRKVFSAIGSFVDIRGGGAYPEIIRETARKPLRVFLQDGIEDRLGGPFVGLDWPAGARAMARALAVKDYDFQLVMGVGGHNPEHGASVFPAAMRWLWRDYPK